MPEKEKIKRLVERLVAIDPEYRKRLVDRARGEIRATIVTPEKDYSYFLNSLPDNQRFTPEKDYSTKRYWELNGRPKDFEEAKKLGMYSYDNSDNSWHANSLAWGDDGVGYFMKPRHHDTLKYELDWYNDGTITEEGGIQRGPTEAELSEWRDFRDHYTLDDSGDFYRYVPIGYADGGWLERALALGDRDMMNFAEYVQKYAPNVDFSGLKTTNNRPYNPEYITYIDRALRRGGMNDLKRASVLANIIEESGGDPFAVGPGDFYGLLQWSGDRYKKTGEKDIYKEIDNQVKYILDTQDNATDRMSWTHGGTGSGYNSLKESMAAFGGNNLKDVMRGYTFGYVRPAGGVDSYNNRYKVADQIYNLSGFRPKEYSSGGGIHIKPENRGKFTALKKRTGHSATWFKEHGTPAQKKMAVFALNAKKWKHADGGLLHRYDGETEPTQWMVRGKDYSQWTPGEITELQNYAIQNPEWFWSDEGNDLRGRMYGAGLDSIVKTIYDETPGAIRNGINQKYLPGTIQESAFAEASSPKLSTIPKLLRDPMVMEGGAKGAAAATAAVLGGGFGKEILANPEVVGAALKYMQPSAWMEAGLAPSLGASAGYSGALTTAGTVADALWDAAGMAQGVQDWRNARNVPEYIMAGMNFVPGLYPIVNAAGKAAGAMRAARGAYRLGDEVSDLSRMSSGLAGVDDTWRSVPPREEFDWDAFERISGIPADSSPVPPPQFSSEERANILHNFMEDFNRETGEILFGDSDLRNLSFRLAEQESIERAVGENGVTTNRHMPLGQRIPEERGPSRVVVNGDNLNTFDIHGGRDVDYDISDLTIEQLNNLANRIGSDSVGNSRLMRQVRAAGREALNNELDEIERWADGASMRDVLNRRNSFFDDAHDEFSQYEHRRRFDDIVARKIRDEVGLRSDENVGFDIDLDDLDLFVLDGLSAINPDIIMDRGLSGDMKYIFGRRVQSVRNGLHDPYWAARRAMEADNISDFKRAMNQMGLYEADEIGDLVGSEAPEHFIRAYEDDMKRRASSMSKDKAIDDYFDLLSTIFKDAHRSGLTGDKAYNLNIREKNKFQDVALNAIGERMNELFADSGINFKNVSSKDDLGRIQKYLRDNKIVGVERELPLDVTHMSYFSHGNKDLTREAASRPGMLTSEMPSGSVMGENDTSVDSEPMKWLNAARRYGTNPGELTIELGKNYDGSVAYRQRNSFGKNRITLNTDGSVIFGDPDLIKKYNPDLLNMSFSPEEINELKSLEGMEYGDIYNLPPEKLNAFHKYMRLIKGADNASMSKYNRYVDLVIQKSGEAFPYAREVNRDRQSFYPFEEYAATYESPYSYIYKHKYGGLIERMRGTYKNNDEALDVIKKIRAGRK